MFYIFEINQKNKQKKKTILIQRSRSILSTIETHLWSPEGIDNLKMFHCLHKVSIIARGLSIDASIMI